MSPAPAGFGKTTLVSDWLRKTELPAAWLSLDEGDNDLGRFLIHFIAALQQVDPNIGQMMQSTLQSTPVANATAIPPIESLMTVLINEIMALPIDLSTPSAGQALTLILDDYHVIDAQPIHQALTFLLNHLPPRLHLVITSRADPPLPLSRLRGQGRLTELRADDLRFTLDEAATFLNEVMGLNLSSDDVQALETRTEGWITGLQLAAIALQSPRLPQSPLSMQRRDDVAGFINSFTGSHRYILDYLADEVLNRRPEGTKRFLLQTSILNRLSGPLCDAVCSVGTATEQSNSRSILETLEAANLFIVPLDDERRWYRYHHLFAGLLRHHLAQEVGTQGVIALHQCACDWYEQNGFAEEALRHSLAAENFDQATHLVKQNFWPLLKNGQARTILGWLKTLPVELVSSRPRLGLCSLSV